jgi:hypothetical protein
MPIARIAGRLVRFAHVPRAGGTAVERYLLGRFGPLALRDTRYLDQPEARRWSRSSPQHAPEAALARLFPPDFFDASFAVVRHPLARIRSVFLFQRDIEGRIPPETDFGDWVTRLPDLWAADPWYLDNHTRPMVEMVPEGARIFRFEDGLEAVIPWLDTLAGETGGPRGLGQFNGYAQRLHQAARAPGPAPELSAAITRQVMTLYAEDAARFGY